MIKPLFWENNRLYIVDQTLLPAEYKKIEIHNHNEMADAIKRLSIRGAPAIGIAAAFGLVLGLKPFANASQDLFFSKLAEISDILRNTRPTAVNLSWALQRIKNLAQSLSDTPVQIIWKRLLNEAQQIHQEDIDMCLRIAKNGQSLIPQNAGILTHCNTGGLATGGLGTALGIIITAHKSGKNIHVFVDETRPLLQGSRLTAWELMQEKVPFTLISDNMSAYIMSSGKTGAVIVGADRIAANGDAANKIGTYGLAVLAKYHNIPFYIAAPSSTIDPSISNGKEIVIEERSGTEVREIFGVKTAPEDCPAISPAFDVTPNSLITAIITEQQVFRPPYYFK